MGHRAARARPGPLTGTRTSQVNTASCAAPNACAVGGYYRAASRNGNARMITPVTEGPHIMSRALTEVRRRFPDMEIRLAAVSDEEGPEAVHRDQLDLAIVSRCTTSAPPSAWLASGGASRSRIAP